MKRIADSGAACFDTEDLLNNDANNLKLKTNGKSAETLRKLSSGSEYLARIRQLLFKEENETLSVNRKSLQELLAGPEETPRSFGGRGIDSLLVYYQSINKNFTGLKLEKKDKEVVKSIFSYKTFSRANDKELPYWLMKELDQKICPYCNMGYLNVIRGNERSYRAAFDHYFPKSKYPYLAISLFNLIPACDTCNSNKGEIDKELVYPYEECFDEAEKRCTIRLIPNAGHPEVWRGTSDSFNAEFRSINYESHVNPFELMFEFRKAIVQEDKHLERVFNSIQYLQLEYIYTNCHHEDIRRMIQKYYEYNRDGIEMMSNAYHNPIIDNKQIRNSLFFDCLIEEEWSKSPLNKLKHDLLEQLDQLSEE